MTATLALFVGVLFGYQRRRAQELGHGAIQSGAVTFVQRFGSALQLNPHFHVLVPEGVFDAEGQFEALPPPRDKEVEGLLHQVIRRTLRLLRRRGKLDELPFR